MAEHPLTDEIIDQIQMKFGGACYECYDAMRAAYDLAIDRCIEWIDAVDCDAQQDTAQRLRKAMRPQENN